MKWINKNRWPKIGKHHFKEDIQNKEFLDKKTSKLQCWMTNCPNWIFRQLINASCPRGKEKTKEKPKKDKRKRLEKLGLKSGKKPTGKEQNKYGYIGRQTNSSKYFV